MQLDVDERKNNVAGRATKRRSGQSAMLVCKTVAKLAAVNELFRRARDGRSLGR